MPDIETLTDEELVALVLKNKDFFTFIIQRYEAKLQRYLKRLGVVVFEDAEDLLQVIFIKVYKNLNGFNSQLKFSSWIYRIAHNETVSFFRARKIRPEGNLVENSEDILPFLHEEFNTDAEAEKSINAKYLKEAMEKLDDKYKQVVILRFFEGLDYGEISDILQIPPGTVATLLHRAKKKLQTELHKKLS